MLGTSSASTVDFFRCEDDVASHLKSPHMPSLCSFSQTFLSTRRGSWVMGRMSRGGLPFDMTLITRLNNTLMQLLPESLLNWTVERELNGRYDHRLYGLEPRHR